MGSVGRAPRTKKGAWLYDASKSVSRRKIKRARNKEVRRILRKEAREGE